VNVFTLLTNPACNARHPQLRRVRCHSAPHHPDVAHAGDGLLWDHLGAVDLCDDHGRRATAADWEQHRDAQQRADNALGRTA
jgi:hypothetical protein